MKNMKALLFVLALIPAMASARKPAANEAKTTATTSTATSTSATSTSTATKPTTTQTASGSSMKFEGPTQWGFGFARPRVGDLYQFSYASPFFWPCTDENYSRFFFNLEIHNISNTVGGNGFKNAQNIAFATGLRFQNRKGQFLQPYALVGIVDYISVDSDINTSSGLGGLRIGLGTEIVGATQEWHGKKVTTSAFIEGIGNYRIGSSSSGVDVFNGTMITFGFRHTH